MQDYHDDAPSGYEAEHGNPLGVVCLLSCRIGHLDFSSVHDDDGDLADGVASQKLVLDAMAF